MVYWLDAVDRHSLHSPFFFDFYSNLVKNKKPEPVESFEKLRTKLLNDNRTIAVDDFGSGSAHLKHATRHVADIANTSLTSIKFSALYSRIIQYYKLKNIVELGASLGINTLYLSQKKDAKV